MTRNDAIDKMIAECAKHIYNPRTGAGVRENGPPFRNRHPYIDAANLYCGAPLGSPWCMSSMSYNGNNALGTVYRSPRTADCDVTLAWARKRKLLHTQAKRGDLFLILNPSDEYDATHTGIVTAATGSGVSTIEGNTNNDGSRDGWGCLDRSRVYSSRIVFVRWADMLDDIATADEGSGAAWKTVFGPKEKPTNVLPNVVDNNMTFVNFRDYMGGLFGSDADKRIAYIADGNTVLWDGKPLPQDIPRRLLDGKTLVGVRAITDWNRLQLETDPVAKTNRVYRPAPTL